MVKGNKQDRLGLASQNGAEAADTPFACSGKCLAEGYRQKEKRPDVLRLQFKPAEPDQDIPWMKKELAALLRSLQGALTRKAQAEYAKRVRQRAG